MNVNILTVHSKVIYISALVLAYRGLFNIVGINNHFVHEFMQQIFEKPLCKRQMQNKNVIFAFRPIYVI